MAKVVSLILFSYRFIHRQESLRFQRITVGGVGGNMNVQKHTHGFKVSSPLQHFILTQKTVQQSSKLGF